MTSRTLIVTDAEDRAALAAVRSLGAAGHRVHVVARRPRSLAGASRHAVAEHVLESAAEQPNAWASGLETLFARIGADWILPVTEVSAGTIYQHDVDRSCRVLCPPREQYALAVDKATLLERAAAVGLAIPRGVLIDDPSALETLPPGFAYPVVLKARRSRFLRDGCWVMGHVCVVRDAEELAASRGETGLQGGALLQEFVPGHGEAIFLLSEQGRSLAAFAHRRLREKPPSGGVSVLRESIAPDPRLLAGSERLLEALGWSGVAMVEFRRAPDGRAVLMEINPRLWGSLQLAIDAGVDFPPLLLAASEGRAVAATAAREGVRTRWLLGDLDHLLICLRRRPMREATGRGRLAVVRDFLRSFFDGSRLEVFRWSDPRPFLRELRGWWRS